MLNSRTVSMADIEMITAYLDTRIQSAKVRLA